MTFFRWSRLAEQNATADLSVNYMEGQAPSTLNDAARAAMAALAKYRDDVTGAIVTTGAATAYLVSSYESFPTLALLDKQLIAFTPHVTNSGTCTLNLDSLGAKPLRTAPNAELPAGTIIQGTPYVAIYNNADGSFYLQGFFGNPYSVPIGGMIDYIGPTAPNSSFVLPFGQNINRITYATLFGLIGTTFGSGDGSTTFGLPDLRGRVTASPDNMGSGDANRLNSSALTSVRSTLGGAGGESVHTLALAELPTGITASGSGSASVSGGTANVATGIGTANVAAGGNPVNVVTAFSSASVNASGGVSVSATSTNTGGGAHNIMQPTILVNRILRII